MFLTVPLNNLSLSYLQNGAKIPATTIKKLEDQLTNFFIEAFKLVGFIDSSLGSALDSIYNSVYNVTVTDQFELLYLSAIFSNLKNIPYVYDRSIKGLKEVVEYPGNQKIITKKGLKSLIELMISKLPNDSFIFNEEVVEINYNSSFTLIKTCHI